MMRKIFIVQFIVIIALSHARAQDPMRFRKEFDAISARYSGTADSRNLIVFTGSSSVRRWSNLSEYFPGKNIINTGFGGSHMSDLIHWLEEAVLKYRPIQVIIYEGDNDLFSGKDPEKIASEAETIVKTIRDKLPRTTIVFFSAKPSPSRWKLRDDYLRLNTLYSSIAGRYRNVEYLDLWTPLLSPAGKPRGELYIKDSLHINSEGYRIWAEHVRKVLK